MVNYITGSGSLRVGDAVLELEVTVPADPVPVRVMLPVLQTLTNQVVSLGVAGAEREGRQITCQAGCGACCKQLVPISVPEALDIQDFINTLPEERREVILERFRRALETFEETGFINRLKRVTELNSEDRLRLGLDYFKLGVDCPFLEEGSCSVYERRPLVCREYLVTSPAVNCQNPSPETIQSVDIPGSFSQQLRNVASDPPEWLPLIFAPYAPANEALRTGPQWLSLIFGRNLEPVN